MKALSTALRLLREFQTANTPLGVGDLSERLGLHKSQVSKVLNVFREHQLLEQDSLTRKYSVGLGAFTLGARYVNSHPLASEALPVMRKLVDGCRHSATLTIIYGDDVIHLMAVEGPLFVDGRWRVGRLLPYHATSSGKVLLAYESPERLEAILERKGLPRITPRTICDRQKFRAVLRKVRETGVAISRGESVPGLGALAVPVFGRQGAVVAALGLVFPDHLVGSGHEGPFVDLLHAAARRLSARTGAEVYPYGGGAMVEKRLEPAVPRRRAAQGAPPAP